jgi:hypothetical protein
VPDYSEFPTTPTGWQERALADWQAITPLSTEDPAPPARRRPDPVSLVLGVAFMVWAVVLMAGVHLPTAVWRDGGLGWVLLVVGGLALMVTEVRRARRRGR